MPSRKMANLHLENLSKSPEAPGVIVCSSISSRSQGRRSCFRQPAQTHAQPLPHSDTAEQKRRSMTRSDAFRLATLPACLLRQLLTTVASARSTFCPASSISYAQCIHSGRPTDDSGPVPSASSSNTSTWPSPPRSSGPTHAHRLSQLCQTKTAREHL